MLMPTIHTLANSFVNLYLIEEPDQLTLIDSGLAASAPKLVLKAIAALGRQPRDLTRIVITHTDPDHTGGAAALKAATGAQLICSAVEAPAMAAGKSSRDFNGPAIMRALVTLIAGKMPPATADLVVAEGDDLPVLGGLRVVASPGHTPGHTSYFSPSTGALFAGDSFNATSGALRFFKAPVHWSFEAGVDSARKQAALGATTVYCGHGKPVANPVFPVF